MNVDFTVGIVGGKGRMGAWFKKFFENQGLSVLIADLNTPLSPQDLPERCQIVILSVPISETKKTAAIVGPLMPEESLLMDLTSNKRAPLAAMLENSRCEVVGAHPLFGPREKTIQGKKVVLCPGRGDRWFAWLKTLFEKTGAIVRVTDAEHHDRLMSVVQGLAHLHTLTLAATIRDLGIDPEELNDYATTSFTHLSPQITRTLRQDANMIASIITLNPEVRTTFAGLERNIRVLKELIDRGGHAECADLIKQVRSYFAVEREGLN